MLIYCANITIFYCITIKTNRHQTDESTPTDLCRFVRPPFILWYINFCHIRINEHLEIDLIIYIAGVLQVQHYRKILIKILRPKNTFCNHRKFLLLETFSFYEMDLWKEQSFLILVFFTVRILDNPVGHNSISSRSGMVFVSWSGRLTREPGASLLFRGIRAATSSVAEFV